uniref:Chitin-binding type-2 domain-containing protein n=1 Tax=Clytia hemisphaerica TaxID=252671 RepID=A0A7M6DRB7_9CNID
MKLTIVVLCLVMAGFTYAGNHANYCRPPSCYKRFPPFANQLCFNLHGHRRAVGYYRYPFSPHLFFYCNKFGVNSGTQQCPAGLWFSEKCVQCLKPYDAVNNVCSKSSGDGSGQSTNTDANCAPEGFCKHKADGLYALNSYSPKFFSCVQWRATQCQSCPAGLYFSQKCQVCLEEVHLSTCPPRGDNSPASKPPKCASNDLCEWKTAGYYAFSENANLFFYCNENYQNVGCQRCPANLVYNQACAQCLPKDQQKCDVPSKPSKPAETNFCAPEGFCKQHSIKHKPLTFLFAVEGDASSFFSCNQLKEATQCLSCPAGLVFNEVCQGCRQFKTNDAKQCNAVKPDDGKPKTDEELNKFRCPDFFCQNRPVGNHETGAGEETFITCSPGNQCIKRWCPSGTVYSKACDACTYSYINFANQKLCKPTTAPSSQAAKCRDEDFCKKGGKPGPNQPPSHFYEQPYVFYECAAKVCYRKACQTTLVYNDNIKGCDYAPNPKSTCKVTGFCNGLANGGYAPPKAAHEGNNVWYQCFTHPTHVECVRNTCPGEQVYQAFNNQCVAPSYYNYHW